MNILIINYEYPPIGAGAATFTRHLAHSLAGAGNQVSIITSRYGSDAPVEIESSRLSVFRIPVYRKSLNEATIFGMISFLASGLYFSRNIIRKISPDICLNFFAIPCGPLALYIKRRFDIPYILCLRGGDIPGFSPKETAIYHRLLSPLSRVVWKNASEICANSSGLKALAEKFCSDRKIRIIHNGTDAQFFRPTPCRSSDKKFKILYVGRMTHQKNLPVLFDHIIPELFSAYPGKIDFTIIGDGPLKNRYVRKIQKSGCRESVKFMGWAAREDLPAIYNSNDLLVLPSLFEGMSNVVLEAKACGLDVAGFNIQGNQELFESERDIMVERNDVRKLIAEIKKKIEAGRINAKTVSGYFLEKFSIPKISESFNELIHDCRNIRTI